jgi:hypothetical protein
MIREGTATRNEALEARLRRYDEERFRWNFSVTFAVFCGQHSCPHVEYLDWLCDSGKGVDEFIEDWIPPRRGT